MVGDIMFPPAYPRVNRFSQLKDKKYSAFNRMNIARRCVAVENRIEYTKTLLRYNTGSNPAA